METQAPEITVDTTVGQVIVASPAPTPTLSPAGPPMSPPYYPAPVVTTPTPVYTFPPIFKPKHFIDKSLVIYGYAPVNSEVSLKGFGVSEKVTSDSNGQFVFGNIYSFTYTYPELCIQAVDNQNRVTQPSCIPALPNDSLIPLEVGPILLSPTVSVSENKVVEGKEVVLTGMTTPNTNVNISISKKENQSNKLSLIKEANAYTLPNVAIRSDSNGKFEVSLPTGESAEYKIFASSKYGEDQSAKSTTLSFVVLTRLKTLFERFINFLLENKIMAFILLEVVIFVILFLLALKSTKKRHRHTEKDYLKFVSHSAIG